MGVNLPWLKNWKGRALLVASVIVVVTLAISYSPSAGHSIPPDRIEAIIVRHENGSSFDIDPLTEEGSRLLSKCEDVLSHLSARALGFRFEEEVVGIREKSACIEIVFKENYEVPICSRSSGEDRVLSSRVLFVLSGECSGDVLFRAPDPSPWGDNAFIWNLYSVFHSDRTRWRIFQELADTVNETQPP